MGTERSWGSAAAAVLVVGALDLLLWRSSLGDLDAPARSGWLILVDATHVTAALGFAALLAALLLGFLIQKIARRLGRAVLVASLVAGVGGALLGGRAFTDRLAAKRGLTRCASLDEWRLGNVHKNDTIARAYVRLEAAPPEILARCGAGGGR